MTRRQRRYDNRQIERAIKRQAAIGACNNVEEQVTYEKFYSAFKKAIRGVTWKASVQNYIIDCFLNIAEAIFKIFNMLDVRQGFIEFDLIERGKLRHIKSIRIFERVIQAWICKYVLYPILTYSLILDNTASQKGKGTHFAIRRIEKHLKEHIKKHGNSGYILLIDFKSYFENIEHEQAKQLYRKDLTDERLLKLADDFIDAFGEKGLGLGSETSQLVAIAYCNKIDHWIKEVARIKGYGRYMDDSYLIHHDKEYLKKVLEQLKVLYAEYGIKINQKKTYIAELKHGFKFLKTRFHIRSNLSIVKKPCRECITRERRKLKKQAKLVKEGKMDIENVGYSFQSWKGSIKHKKARKTIHSMEKLYNTLFKKE